MMNRNTFAIDKVFFCDEICLEDCRRSWRSMDIISFHRIRLSFLKQTVFQGIVVCLFVYVVMNGFGVCAEETSADHSPRSNESFVESSVTPPCDTPDVPSQALPIMEFTEKSGFSLDDMQKMGNMLSNGMSMDEATDAILLKDSVLSDTVSSEGTTTSGGNTSASENPLAGGVGFSEKNLNDRWIENSIDANRLNDEQIATGWLLLFDGETLYGWSEGVEKDSLSGEECQTWCVTDGTIRVKNPDATLPLQSFSRWGNFRLECEIRGETGGMFGIEFSTDLGAEMPTWSDWTTEPTTKVLMTNENSMNACTGGFIFNVDKYGLLMLPEREWNRLTFVVNDGVLTAFLNGNKFLTEMVDLKRRTIVWNNYAHTASIRRIRILPLGGDAMLHDTLDEDWTIPEKNKSVWTIEHTKTNDYGTDFVDELPYPNTEIVNDDVQKDTNVQITTDIPKNDFQSNEHFLYDGPVLRVTNGAGQLESKLLVEDFCLQTEVCVHGDALNSGVFFRCIPGDWMMGYECQIQNGMKNNDPKTPLDAGTGAIYRRQNARQIVAKDRQWFTLSILADEANICTWVNGYPTTCWTDTRKPDDNPRKGLRLRGGSIILQGHDPTTDIEFRRMCVAELPLK